MPHFVSFISSQAAFPLTAMIFYAKHQMQTVLNIALSVCLTMDGDINQSSESLCKIMESFSFTKLTPHQLPSPVSV
jgi:hypothetical protein